MNGQILRNKNCSCVEAQLVIFKFNFVHSLKLFILHFLLPCSIMQLRYYSHKIRQLIRLFFLLHYFPYYLLLVMCTFAYYITILTFNKLSLIINHSHNMSYLTYNLLIFLSPSKTKTKKSYLCSLSSSIKYRPMKEINCEFEIEIQVLQSSDAAQSLWRWRKRRRSL